MRRACPGSALVIRHPGPGQDRMYPPRAAPDQRTAHPTSRGAKRPEKAREGQDPRPRHTEDRKTARAPFVSRPHRRCSYACSTSRHVDCNEARSRSCLAERDILMTADATFRFLTPMPRLGSDPRPGSDAERWAAELRRIEDLGFYAAAVSEHYSRGWTMDALTAMNFALANTTRLRAMPLVLINDLHHPAILAKAIATADVLSGGRTAVGIGAGWLADDYKALGAYYDTAPVRIDRLREALQIITDVFQRTARDFRRPSLPAGRPRSAAPPRPGPATAGPGRRRRSADARPGRLARGHRRGACPTRAGRIRRRGG